MSLNCDTPLISVVIPTYKRRDYLAKAIDSICAQTFTDWELIISDDEKPEGETWAYLQKLAATDSRIRPTRNVNGQGQSANTNHGMSQARGQWIKLLHDDDWLAENCLAQLAYAISLSDENVVLLTTGSCDDHDAAAARQCPANPPANSLFRYRGKEALYGMYMQHDVGGCVPSAMMIRRSVFEQGAVFEKQDIIPNAVDSWFKAQLLSRGDMIHIAQPLMIKCEEDAQSLTNTLDQRDLDREYEAIRELMLPMIDPSFNPPTIKTVQGQVRLIRAMHRLAKHKPFQALSMAVSVWNPYAWFLAAKWAIRKARPGCCQYVHSVALS
jgi:glycosyltransferase involved in cell wall biosynthesis